MADLTQQFPIIGTTILFHQEAQVIDTGRCVLCRRKTHGIRPLSYPTDQWESEPGNISVTTVSRGEVCTITSINDFILNGGQVAVSMVSEEHGFDSGGKRVICCYECQNDGKKYKPLLDACRRVGGWTITVDP